MINISQMTKNEIDLYHREKRKKNLKLFTIFVYILIFMFVVSLGHSLVVKRDMIILQHNVEELCDYIEELEKQNNFLQEVVE
jgi:cell division protein FtsL